MDFRKIFFGFVLILFSVFNSKAQVDTTGFNFRVETVSTAGNVHKNLIVAIDDETLGGTYKISLELLLLEGEGLEVLVTQQEVLISDLNNVTNDQGVLILAPCESGLTYTLVIKLFDEDGHQMFTLNKTILS